MAYYTRILRCNDQFVSNRLTFHCMVMWASIDSARVFRV